jgi:hypothetical protein
MKTLFLFTLAVLLQNPEFSQAENRQVMFSSRPLWTSGSAHCGGDGNARLLDVDLDGDLDLVTSAPNPRRWVLFKNVNGRLASEPFWNSKETTDCDHISVLDFDQDGLTDLAGTHESHCALYFNDKGKGNVRFGDLPDWETGIYIDANEINFGDFDNDGDLDMLMAAGLPFLGIALFENTDGVPSRKVSQRIGIREYSESSIFADFDSDGDLDIIATYPRKGTVVIYDNVGGVFDKSTLVYSDQKTPHCQRVYCLDIDKDGVREIFCAKGPWGPPGASVALARQPNSKMMKVIWRSAADTGFHGFDFRDVDNDGDLDMAAADWRGRSVSIFLQEEGVFSSTPVWKAKTKGQAHEVVFGDIDGDGDLDLVAGCRDQAYVFENLRE